MAGSEYAAILTGSWARLGWTLANSAARFGPVMKQALRDEGEFYAEKIRKGIDSQAPAGKQFKPLSPITLALRKLRGGRGTKILIETKALRNSVQMTPINDYTVFVGIPNTAVGTDGRNLAVVGRVHEYGAIIRTVLSRQRMAALAIELRRAGVPPKFGGTGFGLGAGVIPARPFMGPILEMYSGTRGANRMMARVAQGMGGLLGVVGHPDLKGRSASTIPFRAMSGRAGGSGAFVGRLAKSISRSYTSGAKRTGSRTKGSLARILASKFGMSMGRRPKSRASTGAKARNQKPRVAARGASSPRGRGSRRQSNAHVKAFRRVNKQKLKAQTGRQQNAHVKAFLKQNTSGPKRGRMRVSKAQHSSHVKAFKKMQKPAKGKKPRGQKNSHVKAFRQRQAALARAAKTVKAKPRMNVLPQGMRGRVSKRKKATDNESRSALPKIPKLRKRQPKSASSAHWYGQHMAKKLQSNMATEQGRSAAAFAKAKKAGAAGITAKLTRAMKIKAPKAKAAKAPRKRK